MITRRDLTLIPTEAARALIDGGRAETAERVARRLTTRSIDRVQRVAHRLLARASLSDPETRVALRAEADELDAAIRAAREIVPPGDTGEQPVETALLDSAGVIVWVDDAWQEFCRANGGDPARAGVGRSYLASCDAAAPRDPHSATVARAIRAALRG